MKRFLITLSLLFFGLAQVLSSQSVTVSLPDTNATVGATSLSLPLKVQNFNNIGAISLKLTYVPSVLKYRGNANLIRSDITVNVDTINGKISIGWFSPDGVTSINISDGKLLDLIFDYTNGTSPLNFIVSQSEINKISGEQLGVVYTNGKVSSPIKISLDHVKASPGDTIKVPLRGFNLVNVGSISLKINYNPAVIQFVGLQNKAVDLTSNVSGNTLGLGWFSSDNTPFNLLNGIIADLVFVYIDNSTPLEFFTFNQQSELTDISNNTLDVTYINGSVAKDRSVSLPHLKGIIGHDVTFPLTVKNVRVGSASLDISFDPNVLTFKDVINSVGDQLQANVINGNVLRIGFTKVNPTFDTGKLFDVVFTYKGGTSALIFLSNSEVTDEFGSIYSGFIYNNGNIVEDAKPVFSPVEAKTVAEGSLLSFSVSATDADDTLLTYQASDLPIGATFVDKTFSWTPDFTQAGPYSVKFKVSDPLGAADSIEVTITVTNTNRVPVFTKEMNDTTVNEGQALTFGYLATDPDGDALKYSLVAPVPAGAVIDSLTGAFSWTPGYDQAGVHNVSVKATDGHLSVTSTVAHITVSNNNRPPVFTNVLADVTIDQNKVLSFKYEATDPDGNVLKFAAVSVPTGAAIDSAGNFTWTPTYSQQGIFNVVVSVTDGGFVIVDSAAVTVNKVNAAPYFTEVLNDTSLAANNLQKIILFKYKAVDPNNDPLTFSFVGTVPNRMTIGSTTGTFRFTPGLDVIGVHSVIVKVSDGTLSAQDTVVITVVSPVDVKPDPGMPNEFSLKQNYPNPFNPTTKIKFDVSEESKVVLRVFNLLGQQVAQLVNEVKSAGYYSVDFDASNLNSGIYLYQIEAKNYKVTKKMVLVK
ncbi:MAG: Ig-like domain-containing protein [Ignavibacteriales bacterium]|nr:Ig-like domain-containing protein [Ignavibacteriales bacterium]